MSVHKFKKRRDQNLAIALAFALFLPLSVIQVGCGQQSGTNSSQVSASNDSTTDESLLVETDGEATIGEKDPNDLEIRAVKVKTAILKKIAQNVAVGEKALINGKININLSLGHNDQVLLDQVEKISEENLIFTGKLAGDLESAVTIVLNDGTVVGNFRRSDKAQAYEIRNVTGDTHSVSLKRDEDSSCEEVPADTTAQDQTLRDQATEANDQAMATTPMIDILGAYTPNARIKQGGKSGMIALLQMGVADTNRALADSGVNLQVRLVGTMEVKTNESGAWSTDLSRLAGTTDGKWDEVHAERARLGADQVSLVGVYSGSSVAGIGYINASASKAFTITKTSAFGQYTFAHELGHNLGLQHSDGYVNYSGRFRTIIAYGSYPRIRRYSNPLLKYNGYSTGDSSHNEAAILRVGAPRVAALKTSKVSADLMDQ